MTNQTNERNILTIAGNASPGSRTVFLFMSEDERRMIETNASVAHMNFNDYMAAAGYENSLKYQVDQLRSFHPYYEECYTQISNIKQEWLRYAFQKELFGVYSCVETLIFGICRAAWPWRPGNYADIPSMPDSHYRATTEFTAVSLPDQIFNDFTEFASSLGIDVSMYLLHVAVNRFQTFSYVPLEAAFPYLRNAGHLLGYINDSDLRESILKDISSIWAALCQSMMIFETRHPLSVPCVLSGNIRICDKESGPFA